LFELDYIQEKQSERTSESGKELAPLLTFPHCRESQSAKRAAGIAIEKKIYSYTRIHARNQFLLPQNLHQLPPTRRLFMQILQKTPNTAPRNLPLLP